tara:strand:- start:4123 stop:4362 length:240 start_codon:yes stop_codon:yes gene_type:complete
MNPKLQAMREAEIARAMVELMPNENFKVFFEVLRMQRDSVIEELCSEFVSKDALLSAAAIGELRAYKTIISLYDQHDNV